VIKLDIGEEIYRNILIKLILLMSLQFNFCSDLYKHMTGRVATEENSTICTLLIEDAKILGVEIETILAVAWEESRFTSQEKPTRYKCIGPLQIKYQYWCPNKNNKVSVTKKDGLISKCDVFYHGVKAVKYYIKKFKPENKALCYYNNSKKCSAKNNYESGYVRNVNRFKKRIKRFIKHKKHFNL
jgi:hypothetical protein